MAFLFVPAALRYFALMSPSHRMPSMIIHASMEHLIPSRKVYRASGAHQMLWAGSLQDKRQLAECGFRGHGPSDLERLCRRKDSFRLGILCGRCVNICVEHVARIQFNISKLHNWARYIAIWYKLAMSFSPPTLCLLAGPVVKGRQRSGKGHCQLQLLYSRKSNRLPTADHSRSIPLGGAKESDRISCWKTRVARLLTAVGSGSEAIFVAAQISTINGEPRATKSI